MQNSFIFYVRTVAFWLLLAACFLTGAVAYGQATIIKGKVTDSETGEGLPFVNVYFKGTQQGKATNFEGFYEIRTDSPGDSLIVSSVGYRIKVKAIVKGREQTINFQLEPEETTLKTVEVVYGEYENPAWEVLRNVVKYKEQNDKRRLDAYQYESYTKIEVDVDNITDKFREKKIVQKITNVLDSIQQLAGEDGKPVLPVFISETISDFYFNKNPQRQKEIIQRTKVTGVGVTDGTTVSQLLGSSFQEYNFYKNYMQIVEKDFISPISDSWKLFYDYELLSYNEMVGGIPCYKISFRPKSSQDLAFVGTMWIADSTYAYGLKQIDVSVGKEANLNFVDRIVIQQESERVAEGGAWVPVKSRVLIDIGQVRDDWAGMLAKFYVSNKNIVVNKAQPLKFFDQELMLDEQALLKDERYWAERRHESLSQAEQNVYKMIDTLRNLPTIKTYIEIANILVNGYKKMGKIDFGPYIYSYNYNNIEGHRLRAGFRTNADFSRKFVFRGYLAYGFKDERFKYGMEANYIAARKPWTVFGLSHSYDIDQVGLYNETLSNSTLFTAFSNFNILRRAFLHRINRAWVQTDIRPGITQRAMFRTRDFNPLFGFEYFRPSTDQVRDNNFRVSELVFETRIAPGEQFIQNDNERISLGTNGKPILTFRYTYGMKDVLGGDLDYHRFDAKLEQNFRFGAFGRTFYTIAGGYIPSVLPYPLLETHLGNQTLFYNEGSFNLMNFFEFASDRFVSLAMTHRFEGLLLNRIPLMRKLKWRTLLTGRMLYGDVKQANRDIIPATFPNGEPVPSFTGLGKAPYVEVGYGVENIFRFIRVDFIHRLTYLDAPDARNFGVKVTAQFSL